MQLREGSFHGSRPSCPSTQNNGFIGTGFMSVLRTATASNGCALSVLFVRVAEELQVPSFPSRIRLLHAKPYAAWSKGKVERCFYTLQQGFESTLKLPDNHAQNLEELNTKLSHWIQTVYHLRPHSSTGVSPQLRFAQATGSLRHLDAGLELESLFFTRIKRTVRKDGTVRIEGILYEVDLSLRALEVQLRFDPYSMARIEVYCRGKACGLARPVDLQLNSQLNESQHYDR